jgi:hypothetical protein
MVRTRSHNYHVKQILDVSNDLADTLDVHSGIERLGCEAEADSGFCQSNQCGAVRLLLAGENYG